MNYYPVTDRRTDGQKAMHMSQPCNMHRWAQKIKGTAIRIRLLIFPGIRIGIKITYIMIGWSKICNYGHIER